LYDDAMTVPRNLANGPFELDLAVLQDRPDRPPVPLAIAARGPDGWYHLGTIHLRR